MAHIASIIVHGFPNAFALFVNRLQPTFWTMRTTKPKGRGKNSVSGFDWTSAADREKGKIVFCTPDLHGTRLNGRKPMGILADLFVAEHKDAIAYEALQRKGAITPDKFNRAEFKGLTDLEFGTLWAILQNEEWNVKSHSLETISLGGQGETWLFRFPEPFLSRLSSLDSSEIARAAKAWAATEELQCEPSDVEPVIRELARLAKAATRDSKGLYLWGSL